MNKNFKKIVIVFSFIIVAALIGFGLKDMKEKKAAFDTLNSTTANLASSTSSRVADSVVTLPDGNLIVGLHNNTSEYTSKYVSGKSTVSIQPELLKTKFVPGIFKTQKNPRLDAIVPMYVNADPLGGSLYVVLFQDRGDVALEKSYARIGCLSAEVESIDIIEADTNIKDQEYKVDIKYNKSSSKKEIIIPVIDGKFDPNLTITR